MAKPKLEVRLNDKTLSVNGKIIALDDSLFDGRVDKVSNRDNEYALVLKYLNREDGFIGDEAGDIHNSLRKQGLPNIEVYSYPDVDPPTLAIVGEIDARAYF